MRIFTTLFLILCSTALFATGTTTHKTQKSTLPFPLSEYKYPIAKCYDETGTFAIEIFSTNRVNNMPNFLNHNFSGLIGTKRKFYLTINSSFVDKNSHLVAKVSHIKKGWSNTFDATYMKKVLPSEGQVYGDTDFNKRTIEIGAAMRFDLNKGMMYIEPMVPVKKTISGFCEKVR